MALDPTERRLRELITSRGEALLDDLAELVAIPTGHDHAPGLERTRAMLVERLRRMGARVQLEPGDGRPAWIGPVRATRGPVDWPPVVVARSAAGRRRLRQDSGSSPRVLIVGHIDTVHDPHGPFRTLEIRRDGHAIGPGAVDMKGGLVVAFAALEALRELDVDLDWTVVLNSDEETGSFCSERVLRAEARRHDLGIVVEPALPAGALALERMGSGQFMVEVFGRAAHAGRDFATGVSAVVGLAKVILDLHAFADPEAGMIVNVGPLLGGTATNVVADHAAAWGNVRYADRARGERLGAAIDALATPPGAVPRVDVHRHWNRPAKPAGEAVRAFADAAVAAARDLDQNLPLGTTGGVCDGNILQDEGLPTLDTLGVRGGNLHRLDEFVEIGSLIDRACLLAVLLSRVAAGRVSLPEATARRG